MTQQRWEELLERLRRGHCIQQEDRQQTGDSATHTVIANPPSGRIKMVFTIKPKFLGQQTTYSRRIGSPVVVRPTYSADETVTVFELYQWVNNDWQRLDDRAAAGAFQ